jgi:PleD family two-component response regulator
VTLFQRADDALRAAKEAGRNRVSQGVAVPVEV